VKQFGKKDEIVHENNNDWNLEADVAVMRKILETFPLKRDMVRENLWRRSEAALGDKKVPATWLSALY
jgi:hypothetical protein